MFDGDVRIESESRLPAIMAHFHIMPASSFFIPFPLAVGVTVVFRWFRAEKKQWFSGSLSLVKLLK